MRGRAGLLHQAPAEVLPAGGHRHRGAVHRPEPYQRGRQFLRRRQRQQGFRVAGEPVRGTGGAGHYCDPQAFHQGAHQHLLHSVRDHCGVHPVYRYGLHPAHHRRQGGGRGHGGVHQVLGGQLEPHRGIRLDRCA